MSESNGVPFSVEATINTFEGPDNGAKTSKGKPCFKFKTDQGTINAMPNAVKGPPKVGKKYSFKGSELTLGDGGKTRWANEVVGVLSDKEAEELGDIPGVKASNVVSITPATTPPPTGPRQLSRDESYQLHASLGAALHDAYSQIPASTPWPAVSARIEELYPRILELNQKIHQREEDKLRAGF